MTTPFVWLERSVMAKSAKSESKWVLYPTPGKLQMSAHDNFRIFEFVAILLPQSASKHVQLKAQARRDYIISGNI